MYSVPASSSAPIAVRHFEQAGLIQISISATSISSAPVIATSSSYVVLKTAAGWPAAAQTTSYWRSQGSM